MCYCTPSIRTPYCHNCTDYMRTTIETLRARVAELESETRTLVRQNGEWQAENARLREALEESKRAWDCSIATKALAGESK